jgi:hypothetical protein
MLHVQSQKSVYIVAFVLTTHFSLKDIYAISTLPLPGYQVIFPMDMENVLCLSHQQKIPPTYLQSECVTSLDRYAITPNFLQSENQKSLLAC